jgi:hypothetical protein
MTKRTLIFLFIGIFIVVALGWEVKGPLLSWYEKRGGGEMAQKADRKFFLPEGKETFQIAQAAEIMPRIIEATIDPPDVHVGDKQTLSIIVQDPSKITSVEAHIETDHGVKILPLDLIGEVAETDLMPQRFAVAKGGNLVAVNPSEKSNIENIAVAADAPKLKYEGSWIVKDTHDTRYHTIFVVKDADGNENSITLAWSDACSIPLSGTWYLDSNGNCTLSSVDGVEAGNANIVTYTLTLNAGATFVINPNQSLVITSGAIALSSTGQIKQTYLWQMDFDNDGWPGDSTQVAQDTNPGSSNRRSDLSSATVDCNDSSNTTWQYLDGYSDTDGDGYKGTTANNICSGIALPAAYSATNTDCQEVGTGAANVFQNVSVAQDYDRDDYYTGSLSVQCVGAHKDSCTGGFLNCNSIASGCGSLPSSGQLDVGHYMDTTGAYRLISAADADGGSDCDDTKVWAYRTVSGLSADDDLDGRISGTTSGSSCVGVTFTSGGRTYYAAQGSGNGATSCENYLVYAQRVGTSDCNDSREYIWTTGGGATDRNHDGIVRESAPIGSLCVGDVGQDPWYSDATGDVCWIKSSSIGGYNQSAAADGGPAYACQQN